MAHDISQYAIVQVCKILELALTRGRESFVAKKLDWTNMTGKKSRKELDRQNELRRQHRAKAKHERLNTYRVGAQEEVVHTMVGSIITRLLKNVRTNEKRRLSGANRNEAARARAKKQRVEQKAEAKDKGISTSLLAQEKSLLRAEKPKVYHDHSRYCRERKATDINFKITCNLRTRLGEFMRLTNSTKAAGTMALVGCTKDQLIDHLRERLPNGLDLKEASVDHIFPMTLYDASNDHEQKKMMHFSNLQPMSKEQNSAKNNRLPNLQEAKQVERWAWPPGISETDLQ